jgi:hypothetical protein
LDVDLFDPVNLAVPKYLFLRFLKWDACIEGKQRARHLPLSAPPASIRYRLTAIFPNSLKITVHKASALSYRAIVLASLLEAERGEI